MPLDLNEFRTRLQKIDPQLEAHGWKVHDRRFIVQEVDTKQSDFRALKYRTVDETLKNEEESKYADYVLLDSHGSPLAIVEAKRTIKDPRIGKVQALEYAEDIEKQTHRPLLIFLANGYEIWFLSRSNQAERLVRGFFSRDDLERIRWQIEHKKPLRGVQVNPRIIDRPKSVICAKKTLEHLDRGHRKALLVMATGTGKTRVAMAIIDVLMKANWAQKVLFVADRKTLRDQAHNKGFKIFFPNENKSKIFSGDIKKDSRLYSATIQTLIECYKDISPGYFDVIIWDEAHRSYYDKWRQVLTYYDAIHIGLTATPRDCFSTDEMRDTFALFNCDPSTPTALYDYEEAVNDGVLVDFRRHIHGAQAHFQIKGLKAKDLTRSQLNKILGEGYNPDDINFEGTEFEKKFVTTGTNKAIVREFMDFALEDQSGTLPAKSIFFALSKKHARRLEEAFNGLYPEHRGKLARVIVSEDPRAQSSIDDFTKKSLPRVAISVDMLDTGVDVPEVCNLVFAKPVFSKIKFWQMIGRGTRNDRICEHKDWLPNGKKEYFKIFDFWGVFGFFDMKPEGVEEATGEAITIKIFRFRLEQLKHFTKYGKTTEIAALRARIKEGIEGLPKDSVDIQENMRQIEKALSPDFWQRRGLNQFEYLERQISPLMRYQQGVSMNEASFVLKCEQLAVALLRNDYKEIESRSKAIQELLECLPETIRAVAAKRDLLARARRDEFWRRISFEEVQTLLREFAPLMKYKQTEPRPQIIVDLADEIAQRKLITYGPDEKEEHVKVYTEKVERRIKELAEKHPTIKKILEERPLTEKDMEELEKTLNSPELYLSEDVLRQLGEGTFVSFIKKVLGLSKEEKPEEKIREAFQTYMIENNKQYSGDQLLFISTLQTVFAKKKHIQYEDLWEAPFSNIGGGPSLFSEDELKGLITLCDQLEATVF